MPNEAEPDVAVSDAPENAYEEFGHGDQQFGGGAGEVEYGEEPWSVGADGAVADDNQRRLHERITMDDEREGIVLPGSDEDAEGSDVVGGEEEKTA